MPKKTKKIIATPEMITFVDDGCGHFEKAIAKEPFSFITSSLETSRPIFNPCDDVTGFRCSAIRPNTAFDYCYNSAMVNLCNKLIELSKGEEKKEEEKPQRYKEVDDAIKDWKEKHQGDEKLFTTKKVLQPPTRYYIGKQGIEIAKTSFLSQISPEELGAIASIFEERRNGSRDALKASGSSPWFREQTDYTPEGWRQYYKVKYSTLYTIGAITAKEFVEKSDWINANSFKPGWNVPKNNESIGSVPALGDLTRNAKTAINFALQDFVINAINKDGLLGKFNVVG